MATRPRKMYVIVSKTSPSMCHDEDPGPPNGEVAVNTVYDSLLEANQAAREYLADTYLGADEDEDLDDFLGGNSDFDERNAGSSTEFYFGTLQLRQDHPGIETLEVEVKEMKVQWAVRRYEDNGKKPPPKGKRAGPVGQAPNDPIIL